MSCGYEGHACSRSGQVQFISRYRCVSDFCIGGKRVHLADNGTVSAYDGVTETERIALHNFLLDDYAKYLLWRAEFRLDHPEHQFGPPTPFEFATINVEVCCE